MDELHLIDKLPVLSNTSMSQTCPAILFICELRGHLPMFFFFVFFCFLFFVILKLLPAHRFLSAKVSARQMPHGVWSTHAPVSMKTILQRWKLGTLCGEKRYRLTETKILSSWKWNGQFSAQMMAGSKLKNFWPKTSVRVRDGKKY